MIIIGSIGFNFDMQCPVLSVLGPEQTLRKNQKNVHGNHTHCYIYFHSFTQTGHAQDRVVAARICMLELVYMQSYVCRCMVIC